jgi:hypothetical protein
MGVVLDALVGVSRDCLGGRRVPPILRALWKAQLTGRSFIRDPAYGAIELLAERPVDALDRFLFGKDAAAWNRLLLEIDVFGQQEDDSLLGLWRHSEGLGLEEAPVVLLIENESPRIVAPSIADYIIWRGHAAAGEEAVSLARVWFDRNGLEQLLSPEEVAQMAASLPSAEERLERYFLESD